jgi:hypothetical protein
MVLEHQPGRVEHVLVVVNHQYLAGKLFGHVVKGLVGPKPGGSTETFLVWELSMEA